MVRISSVLFKIKGIKWDLLLLFHIINKPTTFLLFFFLIILTGIKSTKSGKYNLQVSYQGDEFYDRDLKRKPQAFRSTPRTYSYILLHL
jgi:hypothetical protein